MHELSIAVEVVESAIRSIPLGLAGRAVSKLTLDIGKMAGVTVDSLRFCLDIVSRGTVLETAELVINEIPVTARCRTCLTQWTLTDPFFLCEKCRGTDISLLSGREMLIRSIEVEDETAAYETHKEPAWK